MKKIFFEQNDNNSLPSNKNNINSNIANIVFVALFVAVIAVCAQIIIPFGQVPFTLQTLGVFLSASLLGIKRGILSVLIYILLGAVGLPVFSGFSGGLGFLLGPTGGYIVGFLFTAFIVGFMTEKLGKNLWVLVASMVIGILICYAFGTVWFCIIMKKDILYGLLWCVVPYIIPDIVKIVVSIFLVNRLSKIVKL